jgi:hypothetical protein
MGALAPFIREVTEDPTSIFLTGGNSRCFRLSQWHISSAAWPPTGLEATAIARGKALLPAHVWSHNRCSACVAARQLGLSARKEQFEAAGRLSPW